MEIGYNELRSKEVVNVQNGARMGKIVDMIIDSNGKQVVGVVVPGVRKLLKPNEDIFVPWSDISKIGSDVIFVSVNVNTLTGITRSKKNEDKTVRTAPTEDFIE